MTIQPSEAPKPLVFQVYLIATRAHGPPSGAYFLIVARGHIPSAGVGWHAYCGGDPVNRSDPTGLFTIYVHGVNSDHIGYESLRTALRKEFDNRNWSNGLKEESVIDFTWAWSPTAAQISNGDKFENPTTNASDNIGTRSNDRSGWYTSGMSGQQWQGVDKLKNTVRELRALIASDPSLSKEKINIVAHSQGTLITLAALQDGMVVDNVIFMGSPMDKETVEERSSNTNWPIAIKNAGHISNLWSSSDGTASYKGGIGGFGLPDNTIGLDNKVTDHRLSGVDHFGSSGWWSGNWLHYDQSPTKYRSIHGGPPKKMDNPNYDKSEEARIDQNYKMVKWSFSDVFFTGSNYEEMKSSSRVSLEKIKKDASTYITRPAP